MSSDQLLRQRSCPTTTTTIDRVFLCARMTCVEWKKFHVGAAEDRLSLINLAANTRNIDVPTDLDGAGTPSRAREHVSRCDTTTCERRSLPSGRSNFCECEMTVRAAASMSNNADFSRATK